MHSDRNNHTVDYFWHRHGKPSTGVTVRAAHEEGKIMEVAIVDKIQEVMDTLKTKNLINKCTVTSTIIQ